METYNSKGEDVAANFFASNSLDDKAPVWNTMWHKLFHLCNNNQSYFRATSVTFSVIHTNLANSHTERTLRLIFIHGDKNSYQYLATSCEIIVKLNKVTTIKCQGQVSRIHVIKGVGSLDPEVIVVIRKACTRWVYSMWNTQSWEGTEYKAEEADRCTVSKAGKSAVV